LSPSDRPLVQALGEAIKALTGIQVPEDAWDVGSVPEHLRMKVRLVDDAGRAVAEGDDPARIKREHGGAGRASFARIPASDLEREGITRWDFGDLPEQVDLTRAGIQVRGYPALVDQGDSVAIRILDSPEGAALAMRGGLRRLFGLQLGADLRRLRKDLPGLDRLRLQYAKAPHSPRTEAGGPQAGTGQGKGGARGWDLADELIALILDLSFLEGLPPVRQQAAFEQRLAERRGRLTGTAREVCDLAGRILDAYQALRGRLGAIHQVNWLDSVRDIRAQLDALVFRGFFQEIPFAHLKDYPRYLKAVEQRVEKLHHAAGRDQQRMAEMAEIQTRWRERSRAAEAAGRRDGRLEEIRWMLEELRVSLFAQQLGTAYPISVRRIQVRWRELGL
jgi:ATP-dependent helicase HrpA